MASPLGEKGIELRGMSSHKDLKAQTLQDQGHTLMSLFSLGYFLRGPISDTPTLGVRASIYELGKGEEDKLFSLYQDITAH